MAAIKNFCGYMGTARDYLQTPKARHDFKDWLQAAGVIAATSAIATLMIGWISQ